MTPFRLVVSKEVVTNKITTRLIHFASFLTTEIQLVMKLSQTVEKSLESTLGEETLPLYHPMFTTPERKAVRAFVQSGPKQWKEVVIELGPELGKLGQELMAQFTKEEIERNTLREVAIQTQNEKVRKVTRN